MHWLESCERCIGWRVEKDALVGVLRRCFGELRRCFGELRRFFGDLRRCFGELSEMP